MAFKKKNGRPKGQPRPIRAAVVLHEFVFKCKYSSDYICTCSKYTCVAPSTRKIPFRRFFAQIYDWKHLYLCISLVRHSVSATSPATLFIRKCATRRWTLRCSHYSVTKRQQFSCALSTAALSRKFENVVPEGWI